MNPTRQIVLTGWLMASAILISLPCQCQLENHLILKKNGWKNKEHYLAGDEITFRRVPSGPVEGGYLQGIGTGEILIGGQVIPISQIREVIRLRRGFNFEASGKTLLVAAPGFLAISAINALLWDIRPVWSVSNLTTSAVMLVSGFILPFFQEKHYRLGKTFTLQIVQSDPFLQRIKEKQ